MALIKCKECGKEVSNTAKICPHCGKKNPAIEELSDKTMRIIWIMSIIIVFFLFKSCFGGPKPDSKYYQCLDACNWNHHIVGAGTKSASCYSRCSNELEERHNK